MAAVSSVASRVPVSPRRWLIGVAVVLVVVGVVAVLGGFGERRPRPAEMRGVGDEIAVARYTLRVDGAEWVARSGAEPELRVAMTLTNTTRDALYLSDYAVLVRLADGTVLPLDDDRTARVWREGNVGMFDPLLPEKAVLTIKKGLPASMPGEIAVFVSDEVPRADGPVSSGGWVFDRMAARVDVPVRGRVS